MRWERDESGMLLLPEKKEQRLQVTLPWVRPKVIVDTVLNIQSHWSLPMEVRFYNEYKINGAFWNKVLDFKFLFWSLTLLEKGWSSWTKHVLRRLFPFKYQVSNLLNLLIPKSVQGMTSLFLKKKKRKEKKGSWKLTARPG